MDDQKGKRPMEFSEDTYSNRPATLSNLPQVHLQTAFKGTLIVCSYCSSSYEDPRMLSCLHSYCLQCITKIHVEGATSITCPTCNHLTPLPTDWGVASLPVNIRLREEMQQDKILQRVTSSPPPKCDSCNENTSSVAYCKDCNDMLCTDCWNIHKKMKISRSHSTFTLNDLKMKSQPEVLKTITSSISMCPDHDDQKLCFYCTQCNVPVCVWCTVDKHSKDNGHTVQELRGLVSQTEATILQDMKEFPQNVSQLEQLMKNIEETKRQVEDRKHEIDFAIREAFAKLHQLIDQREKALLAENNEIAVSKKTCLSIQQEDAQHLLESIIQGHSVSSIATSEYSDVQLLSIAHTLHNKVSVLASTPLDVCVTPHASVNVNTDTLADVIGEFGGVSDSSATGSSSTAVVPCQRLGIGAEMKVRVDTRDGRGIKINEGGANVRGRLSSNGGKESVATDNGDGTYLVSVVPKQIGQHQLSVTVNSRCIQDSPFTLNIVPQRDYTRLKHLVQTITGINGPNYIAFSDNGDMFVTSDDHCIYVYDVSGNKKATIGSEGNGELQFNVPVGIGINGGVVYVAEYFGHRIHKITTGGEFIGTFGEKGSGIRQFNIPYDVKISLDGKVYVADRGNDRVQVFNSDWTISHVIDGRVSGDGSFSDPEGIAFDLSGDVHVTGYGSSSVTVFTPSGQFVRQYNRAHVDSPSSIAIDPSGYSLVLNHNKGTLSIFHPTNGTLVRSVKGFKQPFGVSVSPDGSVWVADTENNRLVKY